jgi:hypothetical protein
MEAVRMKGPMEKFEGEKIYVVFPFFKTSKPVKVGTLLIRPTDDTTGLSSAEATSLKEICGTLFLKDNRRIKVASYTTLPFFDILLETEEMQLLRNVQSFLAYCYASPDHERGDTYCTLEQSSVVILFPYRVSKFLTHPETNTELVGEEPDLPTDRAGTSPGFYGLYNFKHHFWITKYSRLYPPCPQMIFYPYQDLHTDLEYLETRRVDFRLLHSLLGRPQTDFSLKIFTAVEWFNSANKEDSNMDTAIVHLSIALESLLGLPRDEKTERLIDSISLLLGRVERLDAWARQFYDARSKIVHEGRAFYVRFRPSGHKKENSKNESDGQEYQSLLSYGRQIFQLCLGTLLTGANLSDVAGIKEKLVTNKERFIKISSLLDKTKNQPCVDFQSIAPIIQAIHDYSQVPESGLDIDTMLGGLQRTSQLLLRIRDDVSKEVVDLVERYLQAEKKPNHLPELRALENLHKFLSEEKKPKELGCGESFRALAKVVWHKVALHYIWLDEEDMKKNEPPSATPDALPQSG